MPDFGQDISHGPEESPGYGQPAAPADKLAFVLSGGGALGSVQVGCLQLLLEHGIFPDLIVGTSVGALNGVFLAKNPTLDGVAQLKELWLSLGPHGPFKEGRLRVMLRLFSGREHLYGNSSLRKLVYQYVGDATFESLEVPAVVVATNMETGEPAVFSRGAVEPAVLASTAIPGVFPPINIGGVEYVDGAMMSNCGLETAWNHGARRMVVIETPHVPPDKAVGILKPLSRALQVAMIRLCHREVDWFSEKCPVALLEPEVPLEGFTFDDFSRTPDLLERGKAWTENFIQSDRGQLLRSFARNRQEERA